MKLAQAIHIERIRELMRRSRTYSAAEVAFRLGLSLSRTEMLLGKAARQGFVESLGLGYRESLWGRPGLIAIEREIRQREREERRKAYERARSGKRNRDPNAARSSSRAKRKENDGAIGPRVVTQWSSPPATTAPRTIFEMV